MLRAIRSVIPAEAGIQAPVDPTVLDVDYPAHSEGQDRPERTK